MVEMSEYANRRKAVMTKMGVRDVMVLPANNEILRNGDAHYAFRQDSDFYYLTGFNEPEAVMVLLPNRKEGEYVLFCRPRNPEREAWDGPRAGQKGACETYLADQSFPMDELEERLPELLQDREKIHYTLGLKSFDETLLSALNKLRLQIRKGAKAPTEFVDINPIVHEMRLIKSDAEIAEIQKAVDISVQGHISAMKAAKSGVMEYELEAEMMRDFMHAGARQTAYTTIVGAGKNACVLHYVANNEKANDGDVVLIDAGAEYNNYAADLTRTFPASGKYTDEQKAIYELVLKAQLAAIDEVKPGNLWTAPQTKIINIITTGLVELGLLKGDVDKLIEEKAYLSFYMHNSGHWLGLDVHDVGAYKVNGEWRKFEEGMVLTIEPGIYISERIEGVPSKWHNIGVRIEDDILVTKNGNKVMSAALPKSVADIESLMA